MGKQYYASLFIQLTVPLLDCFICYSTYDWLERTTLKPFLMILFYREIFDILFNFIIAIFMVIYRFKQIECLARFILTLTGISIFINFVFLAPLFLAPNQYFTRYKDLFYSNYSKQYFISLTYLYKCCGFLKPTEIKGQKCRSTRNACVPAIIKSITPSLRSKAILAIFLTSLQVLASYLLWNVQKSGEAIESSEEEEEDNEETPLISKKEQDQETKQIIIHKK